MRKFLTLLLLTPLFVHGQALPPSGGASDAAANIASMRTLGTGSTQAAAGNDARLSTPSNATSTPTASKIPIADGSGKLDGWVSSDAAAATPSLRTLGTSGTQAAAGNDSRLATPSNATSTPTASKIPLADGSGKIDVGWIPSTVATTASITFSSANIGASVNLSTTGTIDWFHLAGSIANPPSVTHRKVSGEDDMWTSFLWINPTSGGSIFTAAATPTFTTTAATDDYNTSNINTTTGVAINSSTASMTGYGYRFRVRATTTTRTLKLYMALYSGTATITCTLTDGTTANTTVSTAAAGYVEKVITITYNAATNGQMMLVTNKITTNLGSSPNVMFMAATIN